jgi:hypothetical protein
VALLSGKRQDELQDVALAKTTKTASAGAIWVNTHGNMLNMVQQS